MIKEAVEEFINGYNSDYDPEKSGSECRQRCSAVIECDSSHPEQSDAKYTENSPQRTRENR